MFLPPFRAQRRTPDALYRASAARTFLPLLSAMSDSGTFTCYPSPNMPPPTTFTRDARLLIPATILFTIGVIGAVIPADISRPHTNLVANHSAGSPRSSSASSPSAAALLLPGSSPPCSPVPRSASTPPSSPSTSAFSQTSSSASSRLSSPRSSSAPIITGIAGHGDLKSVGRMGIRSLIYFEVATHPRPRNRSHRHQHHPRRSWPDSSARTA